jgi:hypothetical protein
MADNEVEKTKDWLPGIPVLVTSIERDTHPEIFHIINANWVVNKINDKVVPPKREEVSKLVFDLAGLYVKRRDVQHISRQPESCIAVAVENAFDALWNGEIDVVTIIKPPGLTLYDFCEKLPKIGGTLQWESEDLNRIVQAIKKAHADYFAEE